MRGGDREEDAKIQPDGNGVLSRWNRIQFDGFLIEVLRRKVLLSPALRLG